MSIEQSIDTHKKALTIAIDGRFDFEIVKDFRNAYSEATDIETCIVDLRATEHMDSSALGMLLNMKKSLGERVNISIINCRPAIKKILTISRFDKKFDIE